VFRRTSLAVSRTPHNLRAGAMNGYNFSDRVRKTLQRAREEAQRLRHPYVGTEHLLLGLLHHQDNKAAAVLANLGVEGDDLRARIEGAVKIGPSKVAGPDMPYT